MTAGSLLVGEARAVTRLTEGGLARGPATLAVVLITREHARPEPELVHVVRQYQSLEDRANAQAAITELRGRGWLDQTVSYGTPLLHGAADLGRRLADFLGDPAFEEQVLAERAQTESPVQLLGAMSETDVYGSYLEVLREAQSEVRLPMLATSPDLSALQVLRERAERGVRVRVLLGSPAVVTHYRGEAMRQTAEDAIAGWVDNARELKRMDVRVCHRPEDLIVASCASIDDRLLRLDVYDPERQRSLDGVMVEVRSPPGHVNNLHRLFTRHFDEAWARAQPVSRMSRVRWSILRFWQWWLAVPSLAVCIAARGSGTVGSVSASLAAAFLFAGIVDHPPRRWRDRVRRR